MKYIIGFIIINIFFSGNSKAKRNETSLVVIVKNNSNNPVMVSLQKTYHNLENYEFISTKKLDTIDVPINKYQYAYISTKNTFIDTILVSASDTLILNVKDNKIINELISKSENVLNLSNLYKIYSSVDSIALLANKVNLLTKSFYAINYDRPIVTTTDLSKSVAYPVKFNKEIYSLKNDEFVGLLLSQYESRIKFYKKLLQKLPHELVELEIFKINYELYHKLQLFNSLCPNKNVSSLLTSKLFINSNLLQNPYCFSILNHYLKENTISKKPDFSRSKKYLDFKEAYDNVPKHFAPNLAKYARLLCLENMVDFGESFIEIKKKYLHFKDFYSDPIINSVLEAKYLFDLDKYKIIKEELKLITYDRKLTSLNDVIRISKGQLVYIDFWASWCAPCRAAMPASLKLKKEFQNKNIVYIYLSIDKDINLWKQASSIEGIDIIKHSYQILNPDMSNFLKEINLKEIPRYLLYDKKGELVHQNAPGPEGADIRNLFNEHL